MKHLNKWWITTKRIEELGYEISFVLFMREWKLCYGWECEIEGENYGTFIWMDTLDEVMQIGRLHELLRAQAIKSLYEVIKIKSKPNDRPREAEVTQAGEA